MTKRLQRWLGVAGLSFVVLLVASVIMVPNTPGSNAGPAKLAAFYASGHKVALHLAAIVTVLAVVVGVFWFWYFRDWVIAARPAARRLATLSFAGALMFAAGGALTAGIDTMLGDVSANHATAATLQSVNYIENDLNNGIIGAGVAIFLTAMAVMVIRYRVLPAWLGWLGVPFALAAAVLGFLGMAGLGLWLIATNIVILRRAGRGEPAAGGVGRSAAEPVSTAG